VWLGGKKYRCFPIWVEFNASPFDFISVFGQNPVHHRGAEGTERKIKFFVYREIPIDENNLAVGG